MCELWRRAHGFGGVKEANMIYLLAIFLLLASPARAQEIYKWQDAKGQWHFGQQPPDLGAGKDVQGPTPEMQLRADIERAEKVTAGNILIENTAVRADHGWLIVECIARNNGKGLARFVKISARVLKQGGNLLTIDNYYIQPDHLRENETGTVRFMFKDVIFAAYDIELVPDWQGRLTQQKWVVRNPYFHY
jgi:hypothetical protein